MFRVGRDPMGARMKVQTRWRNWVLTVEERAGRAVQNPAAGMCEAGGHPPAGTEF